MASQFKNKKTVTIAPQSSSETLESLGETVLTTDGSIKIIRDFKPLKTEKNYMAPQNSRNSMFVGNNKDIKRTFTVVNQARQFYDPIRLTKKYPG